MPWPMVHFSIAEKLFDHDPSPEFLLGSIAPDAIHMREFTTRQDKGKTHLCKEDGTVPDLQVFHDFCKEQLTKDNHGHNQFILGYVSHIYTDFRWTETVWTEFSKKIRPVFDGQHASIRSKYNSEVCQIDYNLYKSEGCSNRILTSLLHSREYEVPHLLTGKEITQYGERVVKNLRDDKNEPRIIPIYITDDIVRMFINTTVEELKDQMKIWSYM